MKLQIEQQTLQHLLARVYNAVEKRQTIPILGNVLIKSENNSLTATATDLDVSVTSTAEATVSQAGATTVRADQFVDIVKGLDKGNLVTLESDGVTLHIKSGRAKLKLASLPIEDFPTIGSADYTAEFEASESDLSRLFDLTAFAMSSEETRYYLQGVYLHPVSGIARAVATDGHRLAQIDSEVQADFPGVIVPRKTVGLLKSLLGEGVAKVKVSETKIQVDLGHSVITSKVIDGTFPDYGRIVPRDHKTEVAISAADVKKAAALVSKVSGEKVRAVKVAVSEGVLRLSVQSGADEGHEEVDATLDGDPVECGFNSKYLADILSACNGDQAIMRFQDGMSPVLVRPAEDDKAIYVCMPMRI